MLIETLYFQKFDWKTSDFMPQGHYYTNLLEKVKLENNNTYLFEHISRRIAIKIVLLKNRPT